MKYFATYEKSNKLIWGLGTTKILARKDAFKNIREQCESDERPAKLVTEEIDPEFYQLIKNNACDTTELMNWTLVNNMIQSIDILEKRAYEAKLARVEAATEFSPEFAQLRDSDKLNILYRHLFNV